ncbi:MAG: GIY-YIG nuclease family protein [Rhodanobacteraceae bacterium]
MNSRSPNVPQAHGMDDPPQPRFASRGRAFVYIVPCREDTVFKVGFSRDPFQRLRMLHPRFFEFFDLDRGLLVATDFVRDARRVERRFLRELSVYQALEPLVVVPSAAGRTEWFRGAIADAEAIAADFGRSEAFTIHRPASAWFRQVFVERQDLLFSWSTRMLDAIEYHQHNSTDPSAAATCSVALRNALDAYSAFAIDLSALVPETVLRWYLSSSGR